MKNSTTLRSGMLLAGSAYAAWGLFPLYFLLVRGIPPSQVLAHRIVWSVAFLGVVLATRGQWSWLAGLAARPAVVGGFAASALLLSGNWFVYIWAVDHGHVIDASLGYFINPLVSILLGSVLLHERLRPAQWAAVAVAAAGVAWLTWQGGHFPWIAVTLAISFGAYGLLRKTAALGPLEGLSLETLLLFPLAASYLIWLAVHGQNDFLRASPPLRGLLVAAGPITAIPLLLFAAGARRIPLSTLGLLQYIAPTVQLLLGVWLFGEAFSGARETGFVIIWVALALYSAEGLQRTLTRQTD